MRNSDWTKKELEIFYDGIYDKLVLAQKRGWLLMEKLKEIESKCDFDNKKEKIISEEIYETIDKWRELGNKP